MTIKQIQNLLQYLGYYTIAVDGISGLVTTQAVRDFQADNGLTVDGVAGGKTWAALKDAVAKDCFRQDDAQSIPATATGTWWDDIRYFARAEFACKCGKYCDGFPAEPDEKLVRTLDAIRAKLGVPVTISSGIRCTRHNANVGGVSNSQHLYGIAADLQSGAGPARMKAVAEAVMGNTGGIGLYGWGIHVDTRSGCSRWNG